MCGRFYIPEDDSSEELQRIIDHLNRKKATPVKTGEVRPTDVAAVIANSKSLQPTPFAMKWGYSLADHRPLINARSETADTKPLFRDGMQQRRCLIPASHYFEWQQLANKKIKNAIKPVNSTAMYMAGLYRFQNGVPEFIILTREPGESIRHIHDRMPVILPREALKDWMNLNYNAAEVMRSAMLNMAVEAEMPSFA